MYVQISYGVVVSIHSKLCGMSRAQWDTLENKNRMKMESLKTKLSSFIRMCKLTTDTNSTYPIITDDLELIVEVLK
ncbi:hypothetical protein phiAS5_ORF0092 [Aeromonas phage phiAS5]|uniref:Uncharacterized protein n=1 Tax=Aeromonas phage phiAS5 TaxID=879630 RepID=E1A2I9_9CAUD|nr:hypothetical protein phiAS5_ORF0092 [Aeromonas phage phiAS5]ADM79935.1 hypothetical protein phiAS5_ORF0092 [Aeromonas phage phiAS5]BES53294.1 hypothetical protein [Aeromonas phage phiWae14]